MSDDLEARDSLLLRSATVVAATGAVVQAVVHVVNFYCCGSQFFDANAEFNLFAWAHASMIVLAGYGATLHALADPSRRWIPLSLAAILMFFSLDEAVVIHERVVGAVLDNVGWSRAWDSVLWPIIYLPMAGAMVLCLWKVMQDSPQRVRRRAVVGVIWLIAAVAAEMASAAYSTELDNVVHAWEGAFEEGFEFVGWTMIAVSLNAAALYRLRR